MIALLFAVAYSHTVLLFLYVFGDAEAESRTRAKHVALSEIWPLVVVYALGEWAWRALRTKKESK